ncbi:hypothetical protein SAMN05660860_03105 [Geoalkalibacter ferrihydriticus]|uniref:DUF5610 domain-containing protein n=1 Tax=Geoalkalibacter ferrihydriticus TaxID=392333 RepID=A0A1G9VQW6_9BACT|nr:hypothetical protein [Geoalkalibacter ferrihydriticus]SDM74612.1 hypothetical protein SAMN05660860_03105 [Geoalkalibacter ferrihydriticus]
MVKGIESSPFSGLQNAAAKAEEAGRGKLDKLREKTLESASAAGSGDKVSLGGEKRAGDVYKAEATRAEMSPQFMLLRDLVAKTLTEQGATFSLSINGEQKGIEDLSLEEAQALVADDGYFGVDQTSQRIVDFAIGLAGNDPSKLDEILAGVERGFQEAAQAFGGSLPDISYKTYDAIREKLDQWVAGFEKQE